MQAQPLSMSKRKDTKFLLHVMQMCHEILDVALAVLLHILRHLL